MGRCYFLGSYCSAFFLIGFLIGCGQSSESGSLRLGLENIPSAEPNTLTTYLVNSIEDDGSQNGILQIVLVAKDSKIQQILGERFLVRIGKQVFSLTLDAKASDGPTYLFTSDKNLAWSEFQALHSTDVQIQGLSKSVAGAPEFESSTANTLKAINNLSSLKYLSLDKRPVIASCLVNNLSKPSGITWVKDVNAKEYLQVQIGSGDKIFKDQALDYNGYWAPTKISNLWTKLFGAEKIREVENSDPILGSSGYFQEQFPLQLTRSVTTQSVSVANNGAIIPRLAVHVFSIQHARNWKVRLQGGCR